VPAGHTDLVFAAIAEDLGVAGILAVAALFSALIWRSVSTALRASTDYGFFLATILALFFSVPVLIMAAGLLGLVPLTGVVTPFLSFGGSAMIANFTALGLLAALRSDRAPAADLAAFRPALRWLGGALGAAAVLLVVAALGVQVLRADEIAVRPHLGIQADGSRRFQYNPRVLDAARQIPRGSIVDRAGLPLASDDGDVLSRARAAYDRLGISLSSACADPGTRCYPLGGRAFHLLGDVTSRANWSASNTSFVERDSEARLRSRIRDRRRGVLGHPPRLPRSAPDVATSARAGACSREGDAVAPARSAADGRCAPSAARRRDPRPVRVPLTVRARRRGRARSRHG
jgi:hypothetical protein